MMNLRRGFRRLSAVVWLVFSMILSSVELHRTGYSWSGAVFFAFCITLGISAVVGGLLWIALWVLEGFFD